MPHITGTVLGTDGQGLNGARVGLYRKDTGALLGGMVTPIPSEPAFASSLHLPLSTNFNDVSTTGATGTAVGGLVINSDWPVNGLPTAQFNASVKRITIPSNPAFAIGTGDFTLDVSFFRPSDTFSQSAVQGIFEMGGFVLRADSALIYVYINGAPNDGFAYTHALNQSSYIRVKRTSGNVEVFHNGVKAGATWANAGSIPAGNIEIGRMFANDAFRFHGGLSHLRLVVGQALDGNGQLAPLSTSSSGLPQPAGSFKIDTAYTGECTRVIQSPYADRNHLIANVTPGGA